ncbi:MAG: ParB N-terminal domain-containing protein, partial [Rhodospirillaceae bacterium]|nr:ParB N-terminal domain-containing protein [Rhodospirillaceae bacterium]
MIQEDVVPSVELIPVDLIDVINPRIRNKKTFKEIVSNIAAVGLKKPITVSRTKSTGKERYNLVCGQGRLEAFLTLGQKEIPAIIVAANDEDCQVMSLVENCARRQHRAIDLLRDIQGLKQRGYTLSETARKTGLTIEYVRGVTRLLGADEHRLLRAVESNQIPLSVAVDIAEADDSEVQEALQQAYERKQLRGKRLLVARRIIE